MMKRLNRLSPSRLLSVIACLVFATGCASLRPLSLESTINSYYRAEQIHDWKTVWSLTHPIFKEMWLKDGATYKEFVKISEEGQSESDLVSWRILSIEEIRDLDPRLGVGITRAVKVAMDVTIYWKDTKKTSKAWDQTDYWMQQDGRWLWYYRGWPTD